MPIVSAETRACVQRQEDPSWSFARAKIPDLTGWIVILTDDDGHVGLGYAHALPAVTTHPEGAKAALDFLLPRLVGRDVHDLAAIMDDVEAVLAFSSSAKCAIDMALHDLLARHLGVGLNVLAGGRRRDRIPQSRIVPLKTPDGMAEKSQALVDEGYPALKLKLSGDAPLDVARVAAVRERVGPKTIITLDANQSYSAKPFIAAFTKMERHDITLVEQPVPAGDWDGMALVTRTLPVPVEADESAVTVPDVVHLIERRCADVISLKIPKLGGIRNTLAVATLCEANGIACRFGAAFGPALLQGVSAHLAAGLKRLDFPCELAEHLHLLDDPFTAVPLVEGCVEVPEGPGAGVTLAG